MGQNNEIKCLEEIKLRILQELQKKQQWLHHVKEWTEQGY
jgi:hypothetical protein